jgi:hypothetical protein
MKARYCLVLSVLLAAACSHEDTFSYAAPKLGPATTGNDVLLTYNSEQDYWPILSEDGSGIVYSFINAEVSGLPYTHRCMGMIPITGGTRLWQYCDDRAALADSFSSFPAYALGHDGRLLYAEATTIKSRNFLAGDVRLWLADTTHPFRRRLLMTLPVTVGDSDVDWLGDLAWTGPTTFIGLGQRYLPATHRPCPSTTCLNPPLPTPLDTIFYGGVIVQGTVSSSGAALAPVPGTEGATSYALTDGGTSMVFTRRDSPNLMKVPASGGVPVVAALVTTRTDSVQLFGVSCAGTTCYVGVGPVTLWRPTDPGPGSDFMLINPGITEIRSVSLVGALAQTVVSRTTGTVHLFSSPIVSADGKTIIAALGTTMGHLQTFWSDVSRSDLRMYSGY